MAFLPCEHSDVNASCLNSQIPCQSTSFYFETILNGIFLLIDSWTLHSILVSKPYLITVDSKNSSFLFIFVIQPNKSSRVRRNSSTLHCTQDDYYKSQATQARNQSSIKQSQVHSKSSYIHLQVLGSAFQPYARMAEEILDANQQYNCVWTLATRNSNKDLKISF